MWPWLGTLVVLWVGLAAPPARGEARFALLIGADLGWADDRPLRFAGQDAERMRDVLVELGDFAPDRVMLLKDPDTATIRSHLRRLSRTLEELQGESLVVVYYAGHADEQSLHLRGAPLSPAELLESIEKLPATRRISVSDICTSGASSVEGAKSMAPFKLKMSSALDSRGLASLLASGADELSVSRRAPMGSLFTHHLVSGMRGAADLDHDGVVRLSEAWRYAAWRTIDDRAIQTGFTWRAVPEEEVSPGELPLTRLVPQAARLELPLAQGERYVVVDQHEVRVVADGYSSPEQRLELVLAPGEYRVKRVQDERLSAATLKLETGARVAAESLSYEARSWGPDLLVSHPERLDPEARWRWRRGEALYLLRLGGVESALSLLDRLLAEKPGDAATLRVRALALVWRAQEQERAGKPREMQEALREALAADPSLVEDPRFTPWHRKLLEADAADRRVQEIREAAEREAASNPRSARRLGLGIEAVGTRGTLAPTVSLVLGRMWMPYVALAPTEPGVDLGLRLAPLGWSWSPVIGVGAHAPFSRLLHGPRWVPLPVEGEWVNPDAPDVIEREFQNGYLHLDLGMQYFGEGGAVAPSCELSAGVMVFQRPSIQFIGLRPGLNLGCSLYL